MKHQILLALFAFAPLLSSAQTSAIEDSYLRQQFHDNKWSTEETNTRRAKWSTLKNEYPTLPYDTLQKKFTPEEMIVYPGISQATAFKRIKEWAAIRFSSVEKIFVYEDQESGKLVLIGANPVKHQKMVYTLFSTKAVEVTSQLCFTLVVTVREGKAKLQFENLEMKYYRSGYTASGTNSNDYFVPAEWVTVSLMDYFPVTAANPKEWEFNLDMAQRCFQSLKNSAVDLNKYLLDAAENEKF